MNDRVKIIRDGREHDVPLSGDIDFELDGMQARVVGRTIVVEPMPEAGGIAPGSYTSETLPPLSDGAKAILASVDAAVEARKAAPLHRRERLVVEDPAPSFTLDDDALPGFDPDR